MGVMFVALAWGVAEATAFFIVPDVYLSWVALYDFKKALKACIAALLGALLGGSLMYAWGLSHAEQALRALTVIPAISPDMVSQVAADLKQSGILAMLLGPMRGIPYKIYAVQTAALQMNFSLFLAMSIPARLIRFILGTMIGFGISRLFHKKTLWVRRAIHLLVWIAFYAGYFYLHKQSSIN